MNWRKEGLQPETWGGDTIMVDLSALTNLGIEDLLDNILVLAEVEQFKANPKGGALAPWSRPSWTSCAASPQRCWCRMARCAAAIRWSWARPGAASRRCSTTKASRSRKRRPARQTMVLGLQEVPSAGDIFERVMNDKEARRIAEERKLAAAVAAHQPPRPKMSLEDFFARMEGEGIKTLNLIVRADMQGTLEPIINSLNELTNDEVEVKILAASIGDISESDVMLAEASDAVIIGFSVGVDKSAQVRADLSGVEIRHYDIIYKMIEDIEDAMKGMLDPIYKEVGRRPRHGAAALQAAQGHRRRLHGQRRLCQARRAGATRSPRAASAAEEEVAGYECGINLSVNDASRGRRCAASNRNVWRIAVAGRGAQTRARRMRHQICARRRSMSFTGTRK
jgi:translation initiation factor IF-2